VLRGGLIDFVINELDSPWGVELIRGVEEALHGVGMSLIVSATHGRTRPAASGWTPWPPGPPSARSWSYPN
jgi:DNA-binding LacI/PurR family transcriptional regulator